ncbi:MAG: class I SAM-dependent methyltransferase, partial [Omnitrophica WOR_2 bacterium]
MKSTLAEFITRNLHPAPWSEGDNIPWNDPDFSARMLKEHLSQEHDAASRRSFIIDRQVAWIHHDLLQEKPSIVLDLGCGPGLYTSRLAKLGHACTGIDYSPASIAYACQDADRGKLNCQYLQEDIRQAEYGTGYDLAMLLFGEFNVFSPQDARQILRKTWAALKPSGILLLEPHTWEYVHSLGCKPPSWSTHSSGLFSDRPHLYWEDRTWDEPAAAATTRYYIVDTETAEVDHCA